MDELVSNDTRALGLLEAQRKAAVMFGEIETRLIRPGVMESQLNEDIMALGLERFGITTHWHKRLVRAGPNTLRVYRENPPDLMIRDNDILFVDLGPVFEEWEADFGRTFVLGNDPVKHDLRAALPHVFDEVKERYRARPEMTCADLYGLACAVSEKAGYEFGGEIAGHLVGVYPHEEIEHDRTLLYVRPGNNTSLAELGADGEKRHWILEIHLIDRESNIGGFYEDLLTVG